MAYGWVKTVHFLLNKLKFLLQGEPIFDLIKDVGPKTELVAFFVPERPEEAFLLPAIQYLRTTLFKRLIDNVLGMISHKMSLITIFGHKHFRQKFHQKFDIFQEKI